MLVQTGSYRIITEGPGQESIIALNYFIKGLLPTTASRVKLLWPKTYDEAVNYAFQIENDIANTEDKKSKKPELLNNLTEASTLKTFQENQSNSNKSVHEKLNALAAQVNSWSRQTNSYSKQPHQANYNRNHPYSNEKKNSFSSAKNDKPFRGICFGCGEQGHSFYSCRKITTETKERH